MSGYVCWKTYCLLCYKLRQIPSDAISSPESPAKEVMATAEQASSLSSSAAAILYPTVLVAEDSQDTRIMLKRAFEVKGYRVFEAEDGEQALEIARRHRPSLMVVDLNMPILDGLEMIKNFRELEQGGEHIPIIAITAYDVYGMEEAALEIGCNRYLSKPLHLDELDRTLRDLGFII